MNKLRSWLIKKLAGEMTVAINFNIKNGGIIARGSSMFINVNVDNSGLSYSAAVTVDKELYEDLKDE